MSNVAIIAPFLYIVNDRRWYTFSMENPEKLGMNLEQVEIEKCKKALELYMLSRREYSKDDTPLDEFNIRMIGVNAEFLVKNGNRDGVRIGGPMSSNMKFNYSKLPGLGGEKMFWIDANNTDEEDPDFQVFQKIVADKFKEQGLPFYSHSQ